MIQRYDPIYRTDRTSQYPLAEMETTDDGEWVKWDDVKDKIIDWQPIETAPKDNLRPLLLAHFDDEGIMCEFDCDGSFEREQESWEIPDEYYYWKTSLGGVEEPTHWSYQPENFARLPKE